LVNPTARVLKGNVGFFWPQESLVADLDDDRVIRGYIHQAEDSFLEVRALDESEDFPFIGTSPRPPTLALFGAAEETGLLIPNLLSAGHTTQFGGSRASVLRYRAGTLITGVDLTEVKSSRVQEASLTFGDGLAFAGLSVLEEEFKTDPASHLVTEAKFTLRSAAASVSGGKYGAYELRLEPDWSTSGKGAMRTLETGLSVVLSVARARPFSDFRPLLIGIQDLLNLAYDRFIPAESGRATVDSGSTDGTRSYLWLEDTMVSPAHTTRRRPSRHETTPLFALSDLGGSAGLRRWLQLRNEFPDVAHVVASGHRDGGSRQPARLLEVAAAIEFYVNANRKAGKQWAAKSTAPTQAEALARKVGKPFEALTGDHAKWANRVRDTNNAIKHNPSFQRDPQELHFLAWSGQVLLLAALLDRAARSKAPSRRILSDYRLEGGGEALRKILGT
jgi:hypothetical protein